MKSLPTVFPKNNHGKAQFIDTKEKNAVEDHDCLGSESK